MKDFAAIAIRITKGKLFVLDQAKLPQEELWVCSESPEDMCKLIYALSVRGAPLIGVAAALSLALYAESGVNKDSIKKAAAMLRATRPTAVNLMWALDKMTSTDLEKSSLVKMAEEILAEECAMSDRMANFGAELIKDGENILTHCNTGSLATPGIGTALGVIARAWSMGKKIHVYVDETRPLLQGARLTAWELKNLKIPFTLICDNMAGTLMRAKKIQRVFVGSDRIAVNGDFANKIGTYSVAVLAHFHQVPFHVVAPQSTFDPNCASGNDIPIEERAAAEVTRDWSPKGIAVFNPSFDVTPAALVQSFILDSGVYLPSEVYKLKK